MELSRMIVVIVVVFLIYVLAAKYMIWEASMERYDNPRMEIDCETDPSFAPCNQGKVYYTEQSQEAYGDAVQRRNEAMSYDGWLPWGWGN